MRFNIKVRKAFNTIEVDSNLIPDSAYQTILYLGLEHLINRNMAKVKGRTADLTKAERKKQNAEAMRIAERNLHKILADDVHLNPSCY